MTKSTITREQLEEWVAQFDEDGGCDATDRQLEALIRQSLAAMDSEPVAEVYQAPNVGICAALGPSIRMLCPLEPGTKLYRHAQLATASEPLAVTDVELNAALQLHRLKVDGHSQLSDAFRAGFRYARRTTPQPVTVVPDRMTAIVKDEAEYVEGWNACRAAMLAAAPQEVGDA
ncbi:hypothetical protein ACNPIP_20495 [Klebsiella pneumoniae]|nr:hypothetical protein [Klebsiella pneumoniae]HCD7871124.1 hypothetical protein [Klebsiella pneumoniae]